MPIPPPDPAAVALVTGASSGLGAEFARRLAARGHGVALVARRAARLEALAADLRAAHGVRAEVVPCDLTDPAARGAILPRLQALGLRVDVLVNNAGFATGGPLHRSDPEQELQQVRLLCEAPIDLLGRVLPAMTARGAGAVINVASTAGMQPLPNSAGYGAAKAYLLSLSQSVHAEVRGRGVTVTALCPGPVRTELFAKVDHPVERAPGVAWMDPPEVVQAALDGADRGLRVVIPGARIRAAMTASSVVPQAVKLRVLERFFRT
jgi:short-subunit dehydrogenase